MTYEARIVEERLLVIQRRGDGMTDRPCATCNQPHPQRRGRDGLPTFAAEDGHPFRVVGSAQAEWVAPAVAYGSREGWRASFFGALLSCERCGTVCDPKHKDLLALHEERCS